MNNRDRTRRLLAVEALFNVIPSDAFSLASSLDASITATARQARRSVSIVITNYNYRNFVGAAVESALSQTVPAREVIVVDDGSTDGSTELILRLPGIVPVLKSNGGQASAFNEGFLRSNGEIVVFLDADDRLLPHAVEKIGSVPLRGVSRVQFGLETIDSKGRSTGIYPSDTSSATGYLVGRLNSKGGFPFMPTSGNAFPREILEKLMPMPEQNWSLCADLYLVLASALIGETLNLGVALGQYRIHGDNGHFRLLGAEPFLAGERKRRQALAWKDLLSNVQRLMSRSDAERSGRALQCLLLTGSGERSLRKNHSLRAIDMVFRAPRADKLALLRRMSNAIFPPRRGRSSDNTEPKFSSRRVQAGIEELQDAAGPSTWPLLAPGIQESFFSEASSAMAGVGWSRSLFDGLRMDALCATLALRLPDCRANWWLRIAFKLSGSNLLRHLSVRLNGAHLDAIELRGTGTFDLRLPLELMPLWMPYRGPSARAACLEFEVKAPDAGRIALQSLEVGLLPDVPPRAPCLPVGREVNFGRGAAIRDRGDLRLLLGDDVLAGGWEWPDDKGVQMAGRQARLVFSVSEHGEHAVTVGLPEDPGTDLREVLQVVVNDTLVAIHTSSNHRSFSFVLPIEGPGLVVVVIEVSSHAATGLWPVVCLSTIRLDTALKAGKLPMLVPNVELDGPMLEDQVRGCDGLAVDGMVSRIVNRNFSLTFLKAPTLVGVRILLRVCAAKDWAEPVAASFMLGERKFDCWLGPDNLIALPVPDDAGHIMRLRGYVDGRAGMFALRSLRMEQVVALNNAVSRIETTRLDPLAIYSFVEMPEDWHPVIDEALWLAGHSGTIRLPPLQMAAHALDVTVLSLGKPLQRLWLACGTERIQTSKAGLQTLRLQIADATTGLKLAVGCDAVVGATAVNATGPRMLGGAICSIAIITQTIHG
ncbi:glycosyltransferase family 2 protein [Mesorhizobium sp. CN2-181]|uniref:glycosyltransferase family 2 protein n=1 Tax=Mesorhizobium yinganensis TaxID=3157707 RepID=UPI0032B813FC